MQRLIKRRSSWSRPLSRAKTAFVPVVLAAVLTSAVALSVGKKPIAPCGVEPYPNYPAVDAPPEVATWTSDDLGEGWSPPACAAWQTGFATHVVALAGHFRDSRTIEAVLAQIGAISSLQNVRYWSVTDKRWNGLFARVTALEGPDPAKPRNDFTATEIRPAQDLYFLAADNRSGEDVVWRLRIREVQGERIIVETANITPLRWFFVPYVATGNMQTSYFLEHEPDDSWQLYSLTRVLYTSPLLAYFVPQASYINRAVALYRHFAGTPTDRDPPAAP
jgi:hypothetical protein